MAIDGEMPEAAPAPEPDAKLPAEESAPTAEPDPVPPGES